MYDLNYKHLHMQVTEYAGGAMVHIRERVVKPSSAKAPHSKKSPTKGFTKKGLALTAEDWRDLSSHFGDICTALDRLDST